MSAWHGILKIEHIEQVRNGKVIWDDSNIKNTLHSLGEAFLLQVCFRNDGSILPSNYYFGLDARTSISIDDSLDSLVNEPTGNGYGRVPVDSVNSFDIQQINGIYRAISPIINYVAGGVGFGPVKSFFMATTADNTGILVSSALLSSPVTLAAGDTLNLKMSMQLHDCP